MHALEGSRPVFGMPTKDTYRNAHKRPHMFYLAYV